MGRDACDALGGKRKEGVLPSVEKQKGKAAGGVYVYVELGGRESKNIMVCGESMDIL